MRFRVSFLLAALVLAGSLGIAWGGPTAGVPEGSDGTAVGHNGTVLALGVRGDGDGTAGGQAHAVRCDGNGTVGGQA